MFVFTKVENLSYIQEYLCPKISTPVCLYVSIVSKCLIFASFANSAGEKIYCNYLGSIDKMTLWIISIWKYQIY